MESLRAWMVSHPVLVAVIALVVGLGGVWFIPSGGTLIGMAGVRFVFAAFMLVIMAIAGGRAAVAFSTKGFRFGWRKSIYLLCLSLAMALFGFTKVIEEGSPLLPDWGLQLASAVALCACIGLFEEGLFRGVLLSGLLARMGSTRKGVMGAVVVSSLAFGVVHVVPFIVSGQVNDGPSVLQAVLKTLQAGIMGMLLAAVFIRTRNLWVVASVHGMNDLFATVSEALYSGSLSTNYVSGDPGVALASIVVYGAYLLLCIPILISAVRMVRQVELPCCGLFAGAWAPCAVRTQKRSKKQARV